MAGIFLGAVLGLAILIPVVAITGARWWHDRQHGDWWRLSTCDHCVREWRAGLRGRRP